MIVNSMSISWERIFLFVLVILRVKNSAVNPRMRLMFAMLLPMMFPRIIPGLFEKVAVIAVASSGMDVPKATKVRPIMNLLIPREFASFAADETRREAPFISANKEIMKIIIKVARDSIFLFFVLFFEGEWN